MESVGFEPTHDPRYLFLGGPRLYRLSYGSVWIGHNKNNCFLNSFLFNNIDDTDYNRFGTISVLGLQSIV